ncbi:hypothetical protein ACS0TY_028477 [Phlomoides rotata]
MASLFALALKLYFSYFFTLSSSTPNFNFTTDEYALFAFRNTITSDPNALLRSNWSSNISVCNWIGVSCGTKHRRVTTLNVSGFHLGGTIAPHLGNLTFLRSLDISSNNFKGLIPSEPANLRRLKELNVRFNSLASTEIPSWLGHLSRLRYLYLNNNTFSGTIPLSLFNISRLQTLDMSYNFLDGNLPQKIANFSFLGTLNLAGNTLTGSIPNGLFNISSLIEINMRYNKLSGKLPKDICGNIIPKLKRIYLTGNQFYGEISTNIYKCRELEDLRLAMNHFDGNIPREIWSLRMLRSLLLWSNHFKGRLPNTVGNLTSLEHLSLDSNNMTEASMQELFITENYYEQGLYKPTKKANQPNGVKQRKWWLSGYAPTPTQWEIESGR